MNASVVNSPLSARQVALSVCREVVHRGQSLNQQLDNQLKALVNERDRAFSSELSYGVCRYYYVLAAELNRWLTKPLKSRDRDVHLILLLGLYQIRFMHVESHAAVNETVKLLSSGKKSWAKGLVNGVLRNFLRHRNDVSWENVDDLSTSEQTLAYPAWMREKINQDWAERSENIFWYGNQRPPMVLRVNLSEISRNEYLTRLHQNSIKAVAHPIIETAVILQKAVAVNDLPGFDTALVSVQDAGAQIASPLLDCKPGMMVLDACAAPGGKTLHILQATENVQMTAIDNDKSRLTRVTENLKRGGFEARMINADASNPEEWFDGAQFDRILLDAPCSASGVIRRHPDIRLLRKPADITSLQNQQKRLLRALWPLLKTNGRLLYSTCSIFKDENENQVASFLSTLDKGVERIENTVQWGTKRPVGRQILPGHEDMDGFYFACLEKQS